jgi:hypothetical protein
MNFMTESVHRFAAARRTGAASMSMFYPEREDDVYFDWALARSWGQLYNGTSEGRDITVLEKPYRDFEREHLAFYTAPRKMRDVSFYFSMNTRDFVRDSRLLYMQPFMADIQAAYVSGFGVDMVFPFDGAEELARHERIVLSNVQMASDDELSRFAAYARGGGTLIVIGELAALNVDGSRRGEACRNRLLGLADDTAAIGAYSVGGGTIWFCGVTQPEDVFQPSLWISKLFGTNTPVYAVPSQWDRQVAGTGVALARIVGEPRVSVRCGNPRLHASGYFTGGGIAVHLINLKDTISEKAEPISHSDVFKNFTPNGEKLPRAEIRLKKQAGITASAAALYTPERADGLPLGLRDDGENILIEIPAGVFSGYALIALPEI